MTLKATIETEFAELLQKQIRDEFPLDLTLEGPLFSVIHPKLIWTQLQFENKSISEPVTGPIHGWFWEAFKDLETAERKYSDIKLKFVGRPWSMSKFFKSGTEKALVEFPQIGTVVLSKTELSPVSGNELHHHLAPIWLNYALSPELWGHVGKWIRFHEKLHTLFTEKALLDGHDEVGYYPLKNSASKLHTHGFQGTSLDKTYLLVLPWTFSLTALNRLEEIVRQEF